jgi:hypothetical protein
VWGNEHRGTMNCIHKKTAVNGHQSFINHLSKIKKTKKSVLIIGPAKGYEIVNIKTSIPKAQINTFDIVDDIDKIYRQEVVKNKIITDAGGIENYVNKEMIGKYDGITAMFSAGWHTDHRIRNLLKIALMLRPGGVALVRVNDIAISTEIMNYFKNTLEKFKLNNMYNITLEKNDYCYGDIIIKRK